MSPVTIQLALPGYRIIRWESNILMRVYVEALEAPRLCPCCGGEAPPAARAFMNGGCGIWTVSDTRASW